jgi:hypothetical protein
MGAQCRADELVLDPFISETKLRNICDDGAILAVSADVRVL